jgi:hypothetical protein
MNSIDKRGQINHAIDNVPAGIRAPVIAIHGKLKGYMPPFLYRCPITGLSIQSWAAADPTDGKAANYESVICTACIQVHLVNPKNGKVLGVDED